MGSEWVGVARIWLRSVCTISGYCTAQPTERNDALGADGEGVEPPADDAVTAECKGGREQTVHQCFPVSNPDTILPQNGQTIVNQCDIGRGAAHVDDNGLIGSDQRAAAQCRGGRAGQQSFDRVVHGKGTAHQAAVRAHDHEFGGDAAGAERLLGSV